MKKAREREHRTHITHNTRMCTYDPWYATYTHMYVHMLRTYVFRSIGPGVWTGPRTETVGPVHNPT
jgi:hypothetical protein